MLRPAFLFATLLALAGGLRAEPPLPEPESTLIYQDLVIGSGGSVSASTGDVYIVLGHFLNGSTQSTTWNTLGAELRFTGSASPHTVTFAGTDLGRSYFGYVNNFAWGVLHLTSGQSLTLGDGNAVPGAAFYATRVLLDDGVAQVASIAGNGASIFYDPTDAANAPLLAGAPGGIYALAGGGVLAPVLVDLRIVNEQRVGPGTLRLTCQGVPGRLNTIEASPNLVAPFTALGTVNVDATGNFNFDDPNAGLFTKRFYRLRFP